MTRNAYTNHIGTDVKTDDVAADVKNDKPIADVNVADAGSDIKTNEKVTEVHHDDPQAKENDDVEAKDDDAAGTATSHDDDGVPIDRGWAWVICFSCFLLFFINVSFEQFISVLLLDIIEEFDTTISTLTVLLSLTSLCYCVSTQVSANVLQPRFSVRVVETCAALVNAGATLLMAGVLNVYVLFLAVLLKACARGVTLISTLTLIGFYFRRRRALATSLGLLGISTCVMASSPLIRYLRDEYGFRGAFLLFAGMELHSVIATLLLRPLSSYKKKRSTKNITLMSQTKLREGCQSPTSVENNPCPMEGKNNNAPENQCNNNSTHTAKNTLNENEQNNETITSSFNATLEDSPRLSNYSTKDTRITESSNEYELKEQYKQESVADFEHLLIADQVQNAPVDMDKNLKQNSTLNVLDGDQYKGSARPMSLVNSREREDMDFEKDYSMEIPSASNKDPAASLEESSSPVSGVEFCVSRSLDGRSHWNFVTSTVVGSVLKDTVNPVVDVIEKLPIANSSIQEISISEINTNFNIENQDHTCLSQNDLSSSLQSVQSSSEPENSTLSVCKDGSENDSDQSSHNQNKSVDKNDSHEIEQNRRNVRINNDPNIPVLKTLTKNIHEENEEFKEHLDTENRDRKLIGRCIGEDDTDSGEEKRLNVALEECSNVLDINKKLASWDITYPFELSKPLLEARIEEKPRHLGSGLLGSETPTKWGSVATSLMGSALDIAPNIALDTNPTSSNSKTNCRCRPCSWLKFVVDLSILKNLLCLLIVIAYGLAGTGAFTRTYLPSYAIQTGVSKQNAALLLTIVGALDMFGRLFFGFVADLKIIRPNKIIAGACFSLGLVNILSSFYRGYEELIFFAVLIGLFSSCCQNLVSALIIDIVGIDYLGKLLALSSLALSVGLMIQHPIQGVLIESTGSFLATFVYVGVCYILSGILVLSEPCVRRLQVARDKKKCKAEII